MWYLLLSLLLVAVTTAGAAPASNTDQSALQVFVRDSCPHCARAKSFLPALSIRHPGLRIIVREVDHDQQAREDLVSYSRNAGIWPPGVPSFVYGDGIVVGFDNPADTAAKLEALFRADARTDTVVQSPLFGSISVARMGLPMFTLALGLLDGFNPCAMWVLLFLLSMLVHLHDRKRMALIAGTFVLVSGAIYYAFMAAWLNLFLWVGVTTPIRWTLATVALAVGAANVADFRRSSDTFTLAIPAAAKPGIYARIRSILAADSLLPSLAGIVVLAIAVNFIELLCTAGLPAIYTAVLTEHDLPAYARYGYLGLYIVGYLADDTLMVTLAVIALSSRKLTTNAGRWLKLISGAVMLALGAILFLRPAWLI